MARIKELPGLQAERTLLAWDRTALGFLANGALLLFQEAQTISVGRLLPVGAAVLLAVFCGMTGQRRARRIVRRTTPLPPAARAMTVLGWAVAALGLAVIVLLV
jgi:putative membrane protein